MRISDWSSDVCSSDLLDPCPDRLTRAAGLWDCCAGGARRGGSRRCRRAGRFGYGGIVRGDGSDRSEEHTSELQSLMRISYAVFCLKKKKTNKHPTTITRVCTQTHSRIQHYS